jgi:hypothetical protein
LRALASFWDWLKVPTVAKKRQDELRKPMPGAFATVEENAYLNQLPPDEPKAGTRL